MENKTTIIKRDGTIVPFDLSKWQAQIAKTCEGVADVSPSMIQMRAQPHFRNGMTTTELDQIALRAEVDLIDEEENPDVGNVNYQYVAGKQRLSMLRKDVYGDYTVPRLYDIVKKNVELLLYTPDLLTWYTEEEWDYFDKHIEHEKDEDLSYAAIAQLIEKYLVRNRATGKIVESPQVRYMVAAATAFHAEKKDRLKYAREFYQSASDGLFTLATPVLAGLGTKTKQFSSCVLIKTNDSLKSIFATGQVMADYAAKRAGIGLDIGRMRPLGAPIRDGEVMHTGIVPFLKKWFGDLRSCSQGGVRNASATVNLPIWHYQFDDYIVLKNNKGTEESRVRQMDYCVVMSAFFWKRFRSQGVITFFDPNEVPDLYEAFYSDIELFERLYVKYEKRKDLRTKVEPAEKVIKDWLLTERVETGRIYLLNIDNVQRQGPFNTKTDPIYQTNLCCLTGDSKVSIFDGAYFADVTIEELIAMFKDETPTLFIKSFSEHGICWEQINKAWATKEVTDVIELEYEGNKLVCTPEHKLLTSRGWIEAEHLREDDILMLGDNPTYKYTHELQQTLSKSYTESVETAI